MMHSRIYISFTGAKLNPCIRTRVELGFTPAVNNTLDVYYGTQYITPGLMVKKSSGSFG